MHGSRDRQLNLHQDCVTPAAEPEDIWHSQIADLRMSCDGATVEAIHADFLVLHG
jgi:hypothetical protein